MLRQNFADGDGRLPRTLERFLGDRGALRSFVNELFDETKRDSAIGRMQTLLGTYFDGDASRLAVLLDPTRQHSPMHQFRVEITCRFEKPERAADRDRGRGRGARRRAGPVGGEGRATSRTSSRRCSPTSPAAPATCSTGPGRRGRRACSARRRATSSLTIDPARTGGADVRIVIEAKDRADVGSRDPRGAARGEGEPGGRGRGRGLRAGPRAGRHRPVRRPRRRRLLRDRPRGPGPRHARRGDPARPAARDREPSRRGARRSTARRSGRRLAAIRAELEALKGIKATLTSIAKGAVAVQAALDATPRRDRRPRRRGRGGDPAARRELSGDPPRNEAAAGGLGTVGTGDPCRNVTNSRLAGHEVAAQAYRRRRQRHHCRRMLREPQRTGESPCAAT